MRVAAGLLTALLLSFAIFWQFGRELSPSDEPVGPTHWVRLTFGLDQKPVSWDGRARITRGRILQTLPWSFEERDRFDPVAHKWFCTSVVLEGRSASSFSEPTRGVLIEVEQRGRTRLEIETKQGNFAVDVRSLKAGTPQFHLGKRASAELLGTSIPLKPAHVDREVSTEDDFPALAVDARGHRWIAWIGYEQAAQCDHLWVIDVDDPHAKVEEIATAREQLNVNLLVDEAGDLWLFWSAPNGDNWEIWAAQRRNDQWSAATQVTTAAGTDFHLSTARGPDGEIWLAWQGFRDDNSDIFVRRLANRSWSDTVTVASTDANEWEPSISIDADGRAWIGYDSYRNGNYDVFLTSLEFNPEGKPAHCDTIAIAASADFEAHATVEAGSGNAVWVAFDAAGPNWGKDFIYDSTIYQDTYAEPVHASRRLELRAIVDGKLMRPATPLPQVLNKLHPDVVAHSNITEMKRFYELPHLVRDGDGRMWLIFRMNRQGYAGHPKMGAHWEFYATTFVSGRWLEPILLPLSSGRQSQQVSAAVGLSRRLQVAWSTGDHFVDHAQEIRLGELPVVLGAVSDPLWTPFEQAAAKSTLEPTVSSWKMYHKGQQYEVYFGDLHRHTDISHCTPTIDGCLVDAYRYALDAAKLDFLAVTDHTRDTDPYPWWRTQKANDLFHVRGTLSPIYGYERSNNYAGGDTEMSSFSNGVGPYYAVMPITRTRENRLRKTTTPTSHSILTFVGSMP